MTTVKRSKVVECGLEVPRGVVYQGWEPGGEYTKPLVMKNVQLQTQRIKYTIKGDEFYSAVYPRSIVLSAGMSYTLPIVFKPRRKEPCEECIELKTSEGAVAISLKAILPRVTVTLPESLKFGPCAVQDSLSLSFHITNTSNVGTHFSWECSNSCFTISPNTGELLPKTSCKLSATFIPILARVYRVVATCSYGKEGGEKESVVELKGVGKYPHVVVRPPQKSKERAAGTVNSKRRKTRHLKLAEEKWFEEQGEEGVADSNGVYGEVVVEFGAVAVGTSTQKWIELVNVSAVTARVSIVPTSHSRLNPAHFTCSPSPSPLPPHSSHCLPLTFSPILPSQHSTFAFFEVITQGGLSTTTIKCIGAAKAPQVSIEETVLNFGNVPCGQSSTALLHVSNHSDVTALFQLQLERGCVFRMDSSCIKLPPHSSHKIPLHFTPRKPAPQCKRITCLAQHQEPMFVYLIGTAYTETIKPVVLQPKHILDTNGEVPVSPFTNYLHSHHEPSGVSVDSQYLQFGCISPHSVSDGKSLHVTNHTEETICCIWMNESGGTFSVTPQEREIPPGTTCLFTAHFKPRHPGEFYFEELECYAFHKRLQSYQNVSSSSDVTPPCCLSVRAQGHSFHSNTHTFTPKLVFETRDVVFPASSPLEPVYRSMTVWNDGDTPALFEMNPDPNQIFTIQPLCGLIPQGQYQTFVMEMLPREAKTYRHIIHCVLNASTDYTQELLLSGTAELSPIMLENQGQLFFKPTYVGATSSANLKITNTAQLPLRYEWKVGREGSEVISVEPCRGVILPSESQIHWWQFSPREAASLAMKAVLHTGGEGEGSQGKRRHKIVLDLFGQGMLGEIRCHPSSLQFGTVVMGTSHSHTITLFNPSLCSLHYSLHVQHSPTTTSSHQYQHGEESSTPPHGVSLDPCEGELHARSSQTVCVTVRPTMTALYGCTISYSIVSTNPAVRRAADNTVLCRLEITGAYPSLVVTDVHGVQAANGLSKARLWEMLSIERLNSHLQEEPSSSELRYAIATRHSMRRRVSVHTQAIEEFQFGAAPLGSGCSVIHLVLENRGRVEAQWGFQFPSDMHLEPEYWADSGALDEVEQHHHDIITNQLFTVLPKTGRLAPGKSVSVLCSFKHTHIGSSKLPVLLKIHRGREILLNWCGVTVERTSPHVFFTSHHHSFHSVPIGVTIYPVQTYELHNAGESAVMYEVDTTPLQALTHSNYLMPILQCLSVQGEVPACGAAALPFIFSPLEAKKYTVDVPISFSTGESVLVTFSGEGLDPGNYQPPSNIVSETTQPSTVGPPMTLSGQLAMLSTEQLSLGSLPHFSPVRRLVFLSNLHPSHSITFYWAITSAEAAAEVVSIHPAEGHVGPGKSAPCRITFYSHSSPATYDLDITCKVVDEYEVSEYKCHLEQWRAQQEETKHIFTISHPTQGGHHLTTSEDTLKQELSAVHTRSLSNSDLRGSRYQVLPPIGAHSPDISYDDWKKLDLSIRSKARPRTKKPCRDKPPYPPTPLLLHLGVKARTHSLTDYANTFGDLDKFYVAPPTRDLSQQEKGAPLCMKTEERDLILSVLSHMTRELLDDSNFHAALERVQREPVPRLTQFSTPLSQTTLRTGTHADRHMPPGSSTSSRPDSVVEIERTEAEKREEGPDSGGGETDDVGREESRVVGERQVKSDKLSIPINLTERLPEVESLIETILENTVLSIVRESDAGEFNITAPHYLVAQQPQ